MCLKESRKRWLSARKLGGGADHTNFYLRIVNCILIFYFIFSLLAYFILINVILVSFVISHNIRKLSANLPPGGVWRIAAKFHM